MWLVLYWPRCMEYLYTESTVGPSRGRITRLCTTGIEHAVSRDFRLNMMLDACVAQEQQAAASLLGVVLAKRPSIADFLVAEGALENVVSLLLTGEIHVLSCSIAIRNSASHNRIRINSC